MLVVARRTSVRRSRGASSRSKPRSRSGVEERRMRCPVRRQRRRARSTSRQGGVDPALDDLERLVAPRRDEGRTQYRVARYRRLPCSRSAAASRRPRSRNAIARARLAASSPPSRGRDAASARADRHPRGRGCLAQPVERRLRRAARAGSPTACIRDAAARVQCATSARSAAMKASARRAIDVLLVALGAEDELRLESAVAHERHNSRGACARSPGRATAPATRRRTGTAPTPPRPGRTGRGN